MPLPPKVWATLPTQEPALVEQVALLHLEIAALRAENAVLQERIRELETGLVQHSANPSAAFLRSATGRRQP